MGLWLGGVGSLVNLLTGRLFFSPLELELLRSVLTWILDRLVSLPLLDVLTVLPVFGGAASVVAGSSSLTALITVPETLARLIEARPGIALALPILDKTTSPCCGLLIPVVAVVVVVVDDDDVGPSMRRDFRL